MGVDIVLKRHQRIAIHWRLLNGCGSLHLALFE
jgi:hypothetical protein